MIDGSEKPSILVVGRQGPDRAELVLLMVSMWLGPIHALWFRDRKPPNFL